MKYLETERKKKYRPVLTAPQISHIVRLCKNETNMSTETINVLKVLAPFEAKIEADAITPSYELVPDKLTLEESLGIEVPLDVHVLDNNKRTKEEIWEAAYQKYLLNPYSCSVVDLEHMREWKYLNDLMTPEETEQYENEVIERAHDNKLPELGE